MKITIVQLAIFMAFIAIQIRFLQMRSLGIVISMILIAACFAVLLVAAFASESHYGMLDVDSNASFLLWQRILVFCVLNLVVVFLLQGLFL